MPWRAVVILFWAQLIAWLKASTWSSYLPLGKVAASSIKLGDPVGCLVAGGAVGCGAAGEEDVSGSRVVVRRRSHG